MNELELEKVSKMTKAEIIKYYEHMSSTVEAKDKEINDLKETHANEIQQIKSSGNQSREQIKLEVRRELEKEYTPLKTELEEAKKIAGSVEERDKYYTGLITRRAKELEKVINVHGALLKVLQGVVDNALYLNEYIVKEVKE